MSGFNEVLARNTDKAPVVADPYSQTVAFSHYNNLAAQLPIDPVTGDIVSGGVYEQAKQCFLNIKAVVESIDHVMDDVVRITIMLTDIADLSEVSKAQVEVFTSYVPTRTVFAVAELPKGARVQIDALITCGEGTIPNAPQAGDLVKVARNTENAPTCSKSTQAVAFSHYNNLTTQLPLDPATRELVPGGVKEQAQQCLKNIKSIMEAIDAPFDDIVKITIFLKDLADLDVVNEVYSTFFPDSAIARTAGYLPARSVIAVTGLPRGASVQMEAVLSHGDGTPPQEVEDRHGIVIWARNTEAAPKDAFSTQSVAFSHYNHISAQLPIDAATGQVVGADVVTQTVQCLENLKAIVESIGHTLADTVKVNVCLSSLDDLEAFNEAYLRFFPEGTPARRVIGVSQLPEQVLVQLDAIIGNAEGTPPSA